MNSAEFQQRMAALPEPVTDKQPPHWEFWRHQLWRLGQVDDPAKFELWPCVYHTMLQNHWPDSIWYEFEQLDCDIQALRVSKEYGPNDDLPTYTARLSMTLIHQAYHIWTWQQVTGKRIQDLSTIVEFGGGYGAMALLVRRLGFKGRYIIYDLPEFSLLQEWYLSQHGIEAEWNPKRKPKEIDLYMGLYSVSEIEPKERKIPTWANSYLFLYSGQWEKWDNVKLFQKFTLETSLNWRHIELSHLSDKNNWYLIGW